MIKKFSQLFESESENIVQLMFDRLRDLEDDGYDVFVFPRGIDSQGDWRIKEEVYQVKIMSKESLLDEYGDVLTFNIKYTDHLINFMKDNGFQFRADLRGDRIINLYFTKKTLMESIKVEIYEDNDSITAVVDDDPYKVQMIGCNSKLIRTIEGEDWDDCMKKHHEIMGWEPYVPFK